MVRNWQSLGKSVGVVPTMGALHAGHLSLVEAALEECDKVVVTIFVNPTQFGPNEDFAHYPRVLDSDLSLLAPLAPQLVFAPAASDMYAAGFDTKVEVGAASQPWEGASRPTHFAGVATVVLKLLNIVPANFAYFGQKDYQQTVVVRQMVRDLDVATTIRICATVRESDGLAMSSRNAYLTPGEREAALALSRSLQLAADSYASGERGAAAIEQIIRSEFAREPQAKLDYVAIVADGCVVPIEVVDGPTVVAIAATVGQTRLIDNIRIGDPSAA
jgi:pantoate--beta-alanine ligase